MSGRTAAVAKTAKDRYWEWMARIPLMDYPDPGTVADALARASVKKPQTFAEFKLFCIFVGNRWGTYGTNLRPAFETIAAEHGSSPTSVSRWMRAAETLGIFRKVRDATPVMPAVYEVSEWWEAVPSVTARPPNPSPPAHSAPGLGSTGHDDPWANVPPY